jgi:hypothetical protein
VIGEMIFHKSYFADKSSVSRKGPYNLVCYLACYI